MGGQTVRMAETGRQQQEFDAWNWEDIDRPPNLMVGFKRDPIGGL